MSDKEYSKKKELEDFLLRVSYNQKHRGRGGMKNKIVINNGKVQKTILSDLPIPEGWKRGMLERGAK